MKHFDHQTGNVNSLTTSSSVRVKDALHQAIKLLADEKIIGPEHYGEGLILSGLLAIALMLEGNNAHERQ